MNRVIYRVVLVCSVLFASLDAVGFEDNNSKKAPLIVEYINGKPNLKYIHAKESIAKRWGINIKTILAGCNVTDKTTKEANSYKVSNEKAYKYYDKKFGKNWREKFNKEVKKELIRADVIGVKVSKSNGEYRFFVTLRSNETGCKQFANWWEVLNSKKELLYRRILFHSHPNTQPFTRSGGVVKIKPNEKVYIRAHMNNTGYVGDVYVGTVESGFKKALNPPKFPASIEKQSPQPDGCAF